MGPRRGATTAKGAIVRSRYRATRLRAACGEMEKNSEPARAMVTRVSPATARACTRARRANAERPVSAAVQPHLGRAAGPRRGLHAGEASATGQSYGPQGRPPGSRFKRYG